MTLFNSIQSSTHMKWNSHTRIVRFFVLFLKNSTGCSSHSSDTPVELCQNPVFQTTHGSGILDLRCGLAACNPEDGTVALVSWAKQLCLTAGGTATFFLKKCFPITVFPRGKLCRGLSVDANPKDSWVV